MSFFAGRNVNDIADNPNELPNNTYRFKVTGAELRPTHDGSKQGITFRYQIIEGSYSTFFPLTDWVQVPDENTPDDKIDRMLSYLKMRLLAFGYSPDDIQEFGPEMVKDCVTREFFGTTSARKDPRSDQTNIRVTKFDPIHNGDDLDGLGEFSDSPSI